MKLITKSIINASILVVLESTNILVICVIRPLAKMISEPMFSIGMVYHNLEWHISWYLNFLARFLPGNTRKTSIAVASGGARS